MDLAFILIDIVFEFRPWEREVAVDVALNVIVASFTLTDSRSQVQGRVSSLSLEITRSLSAIAVDLHSYYDGQTNNKVLKPRSFKLVR